MFARKYFFSPEFGGGNSPPFPVSYAYVRLDYKSRTVWPKIAEDGNSLQDEQRTPTGAGPMVPEEEEEIRMVKKGRKESPCRFDTSARR